MEPSQNQSSVSVYINPKFKTAHINPNFLQQKISAASISKGNNIYINPKFKNAHINPNFLQKNHSTTTNGLIGQDTITKEIIEPQAKILTKTKRKLVRESTSKPPVASDKEWKPPPPPSSSIPPAQSTQISVSNVPLIRLGNRKLIRASQLTSKTDNINVSTSKFSKIVPKKSVCTKYKIIIAPNQYKIDRRSPHKIPTRLPNKIDRTAKYFIPHSRSMLSPKRMIITDRKLLRIGTTNRKTSIDSTGVQQHQSKNKKLVLLNINGVFYKSTENKLQKQTSTDGPRKIQPQPLSKIQNHPKTKTLFVRGEQFILSATGNRLTRIQSGQISPLKRIEIGGLTYVAKSADTWERTDIHKARLHLTMAKHRSINLLSKNLVKSNVPCAMFRKLGKCRGYERGRCVRVHDQRFVDICPKFLKGTCLVDACLLSHNVTLAKMPTCKFYLQGICMKSDCPYLHKKINEKVEICSDFVKGYCEKADKCDRRHDFVSNEKISTDKSKIVKRNIKKTKENTNTQVPCINNEQTSKSSELSSRYFSGSNENESTVELDKEKLTRILLKLDEAKTNLNLCSGNLMKNAETSSSIPKITENMENEMETVEPVRKRPKLGMLPSFIPLG